MCPPFYPKINLRKMKMKKVLLILAMALALVVVSKGQTITANPYQPLIPFNFQIASVTTTNDSVSATIYIPFRCQVVRLNVTCSAVSDTVAIVLGKTNPVTKVNATSTCTATLLTAGVVATAEPTTATYFDAGQYVRIIAKVGTDAGNTASKVYGTLWVTK
jgi:hypothetical protein